MCAMPKYKGVVKIRVVGEEGEDEEGEEWVWRWRARRRERKSSSSVMGAAR